MHARLYCMQGFVAAGGGKLNVYQLPPPLRLDTPWAALKLPLKATPHRLAWFREAGWLAVAQSRSVAIK